jgi:hypothetical protein
MSEQRISQMMDAQLSGQDPFTMAQQMQAERNQTKDATLMGGPFDSSAMEAFGNQQQVKPVLPEAKNLIPNQPASGQQTSAYQKSNVQTYLSKIGVKGAGLAFNDLGRVQLIGRLKDKYGDRYNQVPEALDALSMFDKEMSKLPMEGQKKMNATLANGERTLKALLGGT